MKSVLVVLVFAGVVAASSSLAQQPTPSARPAVHAAPSHQPVDLERLKQALSDTRRKLFASSMGDLTAEQMQAFWAVYADFEKERNAIASARMDLAQKYVDTFLSTTGIADADIAAIINEMAVLQKKNIDVRTKYFDIYRTKIDARTAGRFALVDDYVSTAMRLDLLSQIPFPGDEAPK